MSKLLRILAGFTRQDWPFGALGLDVRLVWLMWFARAEDCRWPNWLFRPFWSFWALWARWLDVWFVRLVRFARAEDCRWPNWLFRPFWPFWLNMWLMRFVGFVRPLLPFCRQPSNHCCEQCCGKEASKPPEQDAFCFHLSLPSRSFPELIR